MDRRPPPSLLPILRSQQQGEILALLLGDPALELSLSDLARRTGVPHPSVHREIERAESAGIVTSRKVGNTRLVRANVDSPYYPGLADVLTRAFGVPAVIADVFGAIDDVDEAYLYGSWAARHAGEPGTRPVADIEVLILGNPDRDLVYAALRTAEEKLGRPIQVTFREPGWLESGEGSFHDTVTSRPLLPLHRRSVENEAARRIDGKKLPDAGDRTTALLQCPLRIRYAECYDASGSSAGGRENALPTISAAR